VGCVRNEMQVALSTIPSPASVSKRKASRSTVDALAAEFEQLPQMADALAMPGVAEIEFDPPRVALAVVPAELS
jgi:hypothetical protein